MNFDRIVRRWLAPWLQWRDRKALRRAVPKLAELDRQIAASRKAHRPGAARLQKARRDAIHEAMRGRT